MNRHDLYITIVTTGNLPENLFFYLFPLGITKRIKKADRGHDFFFLGGGMVSWLDIARYIA